MPHTVLAHGDRVVLGEDCTLRVVHTPGHASNHLCYLLEQEKLLFTGDHLMQGSTVVINPPDGDMQAYLQSLRALLDARARVAGAGSRLSDRPAARRGEPHHRAPAAARIQGGGCAAQHRRRATSMRCCRVVYSDVPERMHPVAARSLRAHLLKLRADGRAVESGARWSLRDAD